MAEVGMAFLSSFLGVIFNKMASPVVVDFICRQKSTDELLKKMEVSLRSMNMVLEDAEEKEVTNPDVKMWIDDLKDVAYIAEDILDEIATEVLRRQLLAEFKPVAGKIRQCPKLKYMPEEGFPASLRFLYIEGCHHVLEKELARNEGKEWLKVAHVPNIMIGLHHIQGYEFPGEFD